MSDRKAIPGRRNAATRPPDGEGWGTATWLERLARNGGRVPAGRHTAITGTLYSYASYKSWADKVRSSWDPGAAPELAPKKT